MTNIETVAPSTLDMLRAMVAGALFAPGDQGGSAGW